MLQLAVTCKQKNTEMKTDIEVSQLKSLSNSVDLNYYTLLQKSRDKSTNFTV